MSLRDNINGPKHLKSYEEILSKYKETLKDYQTKLETFRVPEEDQMAAVQVALDLTYIKEELDEMRPNQEQLGEQVKAMEEALLQALDSIKTIKGDMDRIAPRQEEISDKIEQIDTLIIEPIRKNYTANREATNDKLEEVMNTIAKKEKRTRIILFISLILNFIGTGGMIIVILFILGIIVI